MDNSKYESDKNIIMALPNELNKVAKQNLRNLRILLGGTMHEED